MMEEEINFDFLVQCICLYSVCIYLKVLQYRLIKKKHCKQKLTVIFC